MAVEIERKFLVVGESWRAQASRSLVMRQGYLVNESGLASVRVRLEGDEARLNIKAAVVGSARAEYEYPIPLSEAVEMLDTLCVGELSKIRHYVALGGFTWEVDEFLGENAGLIVAEIELSSVDQEFACPQWVGAEVTDDRRYYNHHLALHPFQRWAHAS